jgi:hypothetical protein
MINLFNIQLTKVLIFFILTLHYFQSRLDHQRHEYFLDIRGLGMF